MRTPADRVIREAKRLRRVAGEASLFSLVPDSLPHDPPVVGDLPEVIFIKIAAEDYAERLASAYREYIG